MSRNVFGWSLPPGVTSRMIDEAYGREEPCEVCGQMPDNCICPECPICQSVGDPRCYDGAIQCTYCGIKRNLEAVAQCTTCGDNAESDYPAAGHVTLEPHGMVRSLKQIASRTRAEAQWEAEARAEMAQPTKVTVTLWIDTDTTAIGDAVRAIADRLRYGGGHLGERDTAKIEGDNEDTSVPFVVNIDNDTAEAIDRKKTADRIDGYDRDDLGESPDF